MNTTKLTGSRRPPVQARVLLQSVAAVLLALSAAADDPADDVRSSWPQFGGPHGDFHVDSGPLADAWPEEGPPLIWDRPLGEGYSAIVAADGRLFTMARDGVEERVVALSAANGATLWQHRCAAKPYPEQTAQYGPGPHATPLVLDGRVFTIGFTGFMHCLSAADGSVFWSRNLVRDFDGAIQHYGHASSPIAYNGKVIVLTGGPEHGVVALNPEDGSVAWTTRSGVPGYATPTVIDVEGQDQIVYFTTEEVVGLDARSGTRLWGHPVVNHCRTNCTSVAWSEEDRLLWAASKGVSGTRVLHLSRGAPETAVEQVWFERRLRLYHWNAVRVGDRIYASTGDSGSLLSVVDFHTGELIEKRRGFASTNFLVADGKLILLDSEGQLSLARPVPSGIEIVSSTQLFDGLSWTVPTLVGSTLYARDREVVVAVDLAPSQDKGR